MDEPIPTDKPKLKGKGGPGRNQGRPAGSRNKATIEAALVAERARAEALLLENTELKAVGAQEMARLAREAGKKLGKEILDDFAQLFAGMAAYYQPAPPGHPVKVHADEKKFKEYAILACDYAAELAPFQSPRLAAMMVGAMQARTIDVKGGLPDPTQPPALTAIEHEQAMKVISGPSERHADGEPAGVSPQASPVLQ